MTKLDKTRTNFLHFYFKVSKPYLPEHKFLTLVTLAE